MNRIITSIGIVIGMLTLLSCGSNNSTTDYQVSISASPAEGGTVSPSNGQHEEGSSLTITAIPSDGWKFVRWEGDYEGTSDSTTVTVDTAKSIKAIFSKKKYPLTVNTNGEGTVDEKILQPNSTKDYEYGTMVELKANAAKGWKFAEWKGGLSGSENPEQITVEDAKKVIAVFEKKSYALTINTTGEGSVSKNPDKKEYKFENTVELTAEPAEGWKFVEWEGDISVTDNPAQITIDESKNVEAIFQEQQFSVSITTQGDGKINVSPEKETYRFNEEVKFEAESGEGFEFIKWEGSLVGSLNPQTITISDEIKVEAIFKTPVEALTSTFNASVLIGGRVHQASLSLANQLPSQVLLKKIIVKDGDGNTTTNEDVGEKIESGKSIGFSISYGIPPTDDDFKKFTIIWRCEYKGKAIEKRGTAGLPSLPFESNTVKYKNIIKSNFGKMR